MIISTENLRIVYGKDENGKYYSQSPPPLSDTLSVLIKNESYESTWKPGMNDEKNLGGTVRTLDRTSGPVPLENGLLSVSGWSLVDDTNSPLLVPVSNEYGYDKWAKERNAPDNYSDWTLFAYGTNYRDCLGDFTKVAGKIPLPPKYAFGIWWSRWWKYTDEELEKLVKKKIKKYTNMKKRLMNRSCSRIYSQSYNSCDVCLGILMTDCTMCLGISRQTVQISQSVL